METEISAAAPELRTHSRLKEEDVRNLEVISDEDFSDIVDSMLLNDYRRIPNVIRLPNIRGDLAEKLGLEKDSAFIMKNGISHIRPSRKGGYKQAFSDEEYRMIPEVMRNANFAVVDKYFKNFQIVFDDKNEESKINKIVFNKDKLGNYLITIGKVDRQSAFSEERNEVVGVGFAPTIRTLKMGVSSTGLRASPTTENSIAQEDSPVNGKESRADEIPGKKKHEMETKLNGEPDSILTPKEYLKSLLSKAEIEVVEDAGIMRAILDEGKRVQKMAAKYGTSHDIGGEENFSGFGTYVVSVNEENARQLGIKIASKRYGGSFYINGQPFSEFLKEKNFSPYWESRLEQFKGYNVEYLADDFLRADVKGNPALEKERDTLSTLFSLDLVEYKRERAFLYSVDIPDNDSTNYLLYGNPIGIENADRINGRLERMNVEWRVSRNDIGKNVYFNTLSEKVFGGSQENASKFLKEAGYAGMEMNSANYIVFDDKDMKVTNRVQYMIDGESNVYGFAYDGKIYADPEIATSNTYAHEYTHLWDAYTQRTNPELWEKGKDIFKGTSLWNEVMADENYQSLSNDDEILSECHSRIVGRMAEKVLSRIAEKNGGILRDKVIDWNNEVAEYVAGELGAEFPKPELGSENYISDSVRLEIAREFLSRPMKDLTEGRRIGIEREKSELYKENEAELKFIVEEMMEETLPGLPKMAKLVENEKNPAASTSTQLSGATSAQGSSDAQDTATAISTHIQYKDNIVEIKNQEHFIEKFNAFAGEVAKSDAPMPPNEFLDKIKKTFNMDVATETTGYAFAREDDKTFKIRISNHKAVLKNRTGDKTEITSVVIQLCGNKGQDNQKTRLSEFVYFPESLDKETQVGIINGINDWISRHEYTDKHYDQMYVSTARALQERLKESEQAIQKMAEEHAMSGEEMDKGVEQIQANGGLSDAAAEADYEAEQNPRPDYLDEQGNPHWFDEEETAEVENPFLDADPEQVQELYEQAEAVEKMQREAALTVEFDENGNPHYPKNEAAEEESRPAAEDPQEYWKGKFVSDNSEAFKMLDDFLNKGIKPKNDEFIFPNVPELMKFADVSENEIVIRTSVINKARNEHSLSAKEIRASIESIASPVLVFASDKNATENKKDSYLSLTDTFAENGKPIAFAMNLDSEYERKNRIIEINEIRTIHDRRLVAKNGTDLVQKWTADGLCRYVDDKKISDWGKAAGVQFPLAVLQSDNNTILTKTDFVKQFDDKKISDWQQAAGVQSPLAVLQSDNPTIPTKSDFVKQFDERVEKNLTEAPEEKHDASGMAEPSTEKEASSAPAAPPAEQEIEIKGADGKTFKTKIEFGKTAIAKFAMVTQNGLESYSGMAVASYEKAADSYLLVSGDKSRQVRVQSSTMAALLSDGRRKEIEKINSQIEERRKTGRSTESLEFKRERLGQGMSVAQYEDFFQTRENCANNFRHNLSVMCRKEANSPLDALKVANKIITQMSDAEKVKTRDLLDLLRKDEQSRNEVLVDVYNEAVKAAPLNEQYLLSQRYDKMIARPMYDTVSGRGEKIDGNFNLKVGDTVKMAFNVDKDIAFGGTKLERKRPAFGNKEVMFSECKIISSSKEGNVVTLMDGNKSFYDVPRDTFLKEYAKREKYERKQEIKEAHKKNIMRLDIER